MPDERPRLTRERIDPADLVAGLAGQDDGATCTFVGTTRDHSGGRPVERLVYEAYDGMAEAVLEEIVAEAMGRFPGARVRVRHRLGTCLPGEVSVVVAAVAPHRREAFAACRYLIDEIKSRAPIWKQEVFRDGAAWVGDPDHPAGAGRTPGEAAGSDGRRRSER